MSKTLLTKKESIDLDSYKERIKKILTHFGEENQKKKSIEELYELIEALFSGKREDILNEMADVYVMLTTLELIYGSCTEQINFKLSRTEERIKTGYYDNKKPRIHKLGEKVTDGKEKM